MKTLAYFFLLLFACQLVNSQTDTTGMWKCGVSEKNPKSFYNYSSRVASLNVVVVFFDFPDGRLVDGSVPTQDWQLDPSYIANPDAVFNSGYQSFDGVNFIRKARKLTYDTFWNIYFSENTYVTDEAHPDWMSHGRFGLPPTGDVARAWGSFKDYYKEVSYGNLLIEPFRTHTQYSGIYNFGIVNQIDEDASGNAYVRPIKLDNEKLSYYQIPNRDGLIEQNNMSEMMYDAEIRLQRAYSEGEIDFDPSSFDGKILMVFAGGTYWIGGLAGTNSAIIREKFTPNGFYQSDDPVLKYSVINGIAIACHEFGHLLGWGHTNDGNYDIMNGSGKIMQNCPSHPNISFKLQSGWISNDRIRKIRTISQVTSLPPVELNGDCAVITIYGKPGYDDNWSHSEYFVIENRRMYPRSDLTVKFDKKLVWQHFVPPTPPGFDGGCLITHCTSYNDFIPPASIGNVKHKIVSACPGRAWNLLYDEGNSKDFFGVLVSGDPPLVYDALNSNRTNSSFGLLTGINILSISANSDKTINFQSYYSIEEPPDYNSVLYSGMNIPDPLEINGAVFYTLQSVFNRVIIVRPGAVVDFVNGSIISGPNSNIIADGTEQNQITFRGCGYGMYRLGFQGLVVGNRPPLTVTPYTKINFCNFNNITDSTGIIAATSAQSQDVPYIIENNYFSNTSSKIRIVSSNASLLLQSVKGNNSNIDLLINPGFNISVTNKIEILPGKILTFAPTYLNSNILFNEGAILDIKGGIIAHRSAESEKIIFDRLSGTSQWGGIQINGGYCDFNYCEIKNSAFSIDINNPSNQILIDNCSFENNSQNDIKLSNFAPVTTNVHLIQNNTFSGNSSIQSSISCNTGTNVDILNNIISESWNNGIILYNVTNPGIIENQINGYTGPPANPSSGIANYSGAGNINCNLIEHFDNAVYLDNSSPKLCNNEFTDNSFGLYLVNGSHPQLTPTISDSKTLPDGGYNRIHDNALAEIKCSNPAGLPMSLPVLADGYNSIYDEGVDDCLFDFQIVLPTQYIIKNNYWGINGPAGRICPSEQNVIYLPFLTQPPSLNPCYQYQNGGKKSIAKEDKQLENCELPKIYALHQNYPNPFNPAAKIRYEIPLESKVSIKIFDLLGRLVETLVDEVKQAGFHEIIFDGTNLASGVYLYRIEAGSFVEVKKMILIK